MNKLLHLINLNGDLLLRLVEFRVVKSSRELVDKLDFTVISGLLKLGLVGKIWDFVEHFVVD